MSLESGRLHTDLTTDAFSASSSPFPLKDEGLFSHQNRVQMPLTPALSSDLDKTTFLKFGIKRAYDPDQGSAAVDVNRDAQVCGGSADTHIDAGLALAPRPTSEH